MKRSSKIVLLFCFFTTLLSGGIPLIAQQAFGWILSDGNNPEEVGPCSFEVGNPQNIKILRKHDYGICAGAFIGKKYYVYAYRSTTGGSTPICFGTYDFEQGSLTPIADYSSMQTLFYDMTYDYRNGTLWALGLSGNVSTLLIVNPDNGAIDKSIKLDRRLFTLAANLSGELFGEDEYGTLCQISQDGTIEEKNSADYFPDKVVQSMAFNHLKGKLYWIIPTEREGTQLLEVNPKTGFLENNTEIANDRQIAGFDFPYSTVKPTAPSTPLLSITPKKPGALNVTIQITIPTKSVDGNNLSESMTLFLKRNGVVLYKGENLQPGKTVSYEDVAPKDGIYTYSVCAQNSSGNGEENVQRLFVGEDLPEAVLNLQVIANNSSECIIKWQAPRKGKDGGYLPPNIRYTIERLPDHIQVAKEIAETSYVDRSITQIGNYQYVVTPITNKGGGDRQTSQEIILGEAYSTPYQCFFASADMPLWSIIDRDKDGIEWKRMMTPQGIECAESARQGDDWLISSPITFKANIPYKLSFKAGSYSEELPEKLTVWIGKGNREQDLTAFKPLQAFVISNEEGERRTYTLYFSLKDLNLAAGNYRIAFQKHSDPDMFHLELLSILCREAEEGSLKGSVFGRDKQPIASATVSLRGTNHRTQSQQDGTWKMDKIQEGQYTLEISKEGFALYAETIEISREQETQKQVTLKPLQKTTAEGKITYNEGKALSEAFVCLTTQAKSSSEKAQIYTAHTDKEGKFLITGLYEGKYALSVYREGLEEHHSEVELTATVSNTIPPIELKDAILPPRCISAIVDKNKATIAWQAPIAQKEITYFSLPGVARIGVFDPTERSVVGTVFRQDMALTQVSWMTDGEREKHSQVDLVLFALDSNGEPTRSILYEKKNIENKDNQWTTYEFPQPLAIQGGVLVALRYNGYLSLLADEGSMGGKHFTPHVYVINKDYLNNDFEYLDQHNMEKNLLLSVGYTTLNKDGSIPSTVQRQKGYKVYRTEESDNPSQEQGAIPMVEVGEIPANQYSIEDPEWSRLPMGYYKYHIQSVGNSEEQKSIIKSTAPMGKDLSTEITFKVTTNAGPVSISPRIQLVSQEVSGAIYTASPKGKTEWTIPTLPKGKYILHASLDGFDEIELPVTYDKDNHYTQELTFVERLLAPYNLKIKKTGKDFERELTWNTDAYLFDGFEEYPAFTLEPATPALNWIYWDMDKDLTVEFQDLTFQHSGEAMSYIVFDPHETNPNMAFLDKGSLAFSGKRYLASFGNRFRGNRDYLFSPVLNFDGTVLLRFMAKSFSNQLGKAIVRVGYTTQEYPKTEDQITWLTQPIELSDHQWQKIETEVPTQSKRIVVAHLSTKAYFIMLDNLFVGEENPYADGSMQKPLVDRATYEIVLDGKTITGQEQYKQTLSNMSVGQHTVQVTALYASGKSETKSLSFEIPQEESTDEISHNHSILLTQEDGGILLSQAHPYEKVEVISMQGEQLFVSLIREDGTLRINTQEWASGMYIVRIGRSVFKVVF